MDWKEALEAARAEHAELVQERDLIEATRADLDVKAELVDKRAIQLEGTIAALSELTGESQSLRRIPITADLNSMKLANACRQILMSAVKFWTPITVRDELLTLGYDLTPYTNHLASIHAVLKRLFDSGEAVRIAGPDGKAMYRWKEPPPQRASPVLTRTTGFSGAPEPPTRPRWKSVPTAEEALEGERKRAEVRAIMAAAKDSRRYRVPIEPTIPLKPRTKKD